MTKHFCQMKMFLFVDWCGSSLSHCGFGSWAQRRYSVFQSDLSGDGATENIANNFVHEAPASFYQPPSIGEDNRQQNFAVLSRVVNALVVLCAIAVGSL
jgi:hypothetical protein